MTTQRNHNTTTTETEANARLIAAAPELLWATQRALAIYEISQFPKKDYGRARWTKAEIKQSWEHWADIARAAIVQAGETP